MSTLNNKTIASTYTSLLKMESDGAVDGTLTSVESGDGTTTALKLSTTNVEAAALTITTLADGASDTKMLTVDASNNVRKADIPDSALTVSHTGTVDPVMTLTQAGTANSVKFIGDGMNVSGGYDGVTRTITFTPQLAGFSSTALMSFNPQGISPSLNGSTLLCTLTKGDASGTSKVSLPPAATGLYFKILLTDNYTGGGFSFAIEAAAQDYISGNVKVIFNDGAGSQSSLLSGTATKVNLGNSGDLGGAIGDTLEFRAIATDRWLVTATLNRNANYTSGTGALTGIFT